MRIMNWFEMGEIFGCRVRMVKNGVVVGELVEDLVFSF